MEIKNKNIFYLNILKFYYYYKIFIYTLQN